MDPHQPMPRCTVRLVAFVGRGRALAELLEEGAQRMVRAAASQTSRPAEEYGTRHAAKLHLRGHRPAGGLHVPQQADRALQL